MDSTSPTDGASGPDPAEADEPGGPAPATDEPADHGEPAPAPRRPRRRLDRRALAICLCIAVVAALVAGLATSALVGRDDEPAPDSGLDLSNPVDTDALGDVELLTVDGRPTTLGHHLSGRPMVVNLWAQSCAPCVAEMPLFEGLHQDRPDIDVFGVDTQDRLDRALVLAEKTGITYPWVQDPSGDFFYAAKGAGMPTTLIVNPAGVVIAAKTGAFDDAAELADWVDRYVGPAGS